MIVVNKKKAKNRTKAKRKCWVSKRRYSSNLKTGKLISEAKTEKVWTLFIQVSFRLLCKLQSNLNKIQITLYLFLFDL